MPHFPISLGCYLVSVYHPRRWGSFQGIDRASHAPSASVQNMGVNHRGLDIFMTEQLLNRPDVISVLQEVGREGMAQGVPGRRLGDRHGLRPGRLAGGVLDGVMAETEWRRGRADSAGRTGPPVRLGSGALSFAEPMEPPPTVVTGRGNEPEGTPDRFSLPSPTASWQASDGSPGQGRHGGGSLRPRGGAACPPNPPTRPWPALSAGVSSQGPGGWKGVDGGWNTFTRLAVRGNGPPMEQWIRSACGRRWELTLR